MYIWKTFANHFDRTIYRIIVYHKHFHINTCGGILHGKQGLFQKVTYIVIYNDDG